VSLYRSSGFFWRHRRTIRRNSWGMSARASGIGSGSASMIFASVESVVVPRKGRVPAASSYSITPNEKTSERESTASPFACSGDI